MMSYPVLFGYRDLVTGRDFVAYVEMDGRAVLREEDDGWWLDGVYPGAIAAGGPTIADAGREFKKRYLSVLYDAAADAESFDVFHQVIEGFFHGCDDATKQAWDKAHAEVKRGQLEHAGLPTRDATTRPPKVTIRRLKDETNRQTNRFNRIDSDIELAEAA